MRREFFGGVLVLVSALGLAQRAAGAETAEASRDRFLKAVQEIQARHYALAVDALDSLLAEEPGNARVAFYLGRAYYETGDRPMASRYFQLAARLNPGLTAAHLYLGRIALELGLPDAAQSELAWALRLDAGLAEAHYWAGRAWEAKGKTPEALAEYRKAHRLDPKDARTQEAQDRLSR